MITGEALDAGVGTHRRMRPPRVDIRPHRRWVDIYPPTAWADIDTGEADLTQADLAKRIGADRKFIHQVESGQGTLYTTRLFAHLRELGLDLEVRVR